MVTVVAASVQDKGNSFCVVLWNTRLRGSMIGFGAIVVRSLRRAELHYRMLVKAGTGLRGHMLVDFPLSIVAENRSKDSESLVASILLLRDVYQVTLSYVRHWQGPSW